MLTADDRCCHTASEGDNFRVKLKDSKYVAVGNGAMTVGDVKVFLGTAIQSIRSGSVEKLEEICSVAVSLSADLEPEKEGDSLKCKFVAPPQTHTRILFLAFPDCLRVLAIHTECSAWCACWQVTHGRRTSSLLLDRRHWREESGKWERSSSHRKRLSRH